MPIYEYHCQDCERHLEAIQKFTDDPLTVCPHCGGHLRKLISPTSFVLKGSGWYATDYPSADRKKGLKAQEQASGDKKEVKKEDTKEAKTETEKVPS